MQARDNACNHSRASQQLKHAITKPCMHTQMATALFSPVLNGLNSPPAAVRFPLLDPAETYDPNTFDYSSTVAGQPGRAQWINVFR